MTVTGTAMPASSGPVTAPVPGEAILLRGVGGNFLLADRGELVGVATARGILRREGVVPTAGDRVLYSPTGDPDVPFCIDSVLPRRNLLPRPSIANLDVLFITVSAAEPSPDLFLVDKILILCSVHKIRPIICVTKSDLDAGCADRILEVYHTAGFAVHRSGLQDLDDLDALRSEIPGCIVGFAGQSGVGKSTVLNRLAEKWLMETGELSLRIRRGRHTTRRVELFPFMGGYLADTPGFSSLDLWDVGVTGSQVVSGYPEILHMGDVCRFQGCRHVSEPGCAVSASVEIDSGRLERYRRFRSSLDAMDPYAKHRA